MAMTEGMPADDAPRPRPAADSTAADSTAADNPSAAEELPAEARDAIPLQQDGGSGHAESSLTVAIAFLANLLIAVAKTGAALLTGSASLVAEAAHSWADTGNEVFLVLANRRSRRPPDPAHPEGYGREAYVWALFAAMGLFVAGGAVSITHGVQELFGGEDAGDYLIGYIVLAVSFVLEGVSFLQSARQVRNEAASMDRDVIEHVLETSDPTLRAVFAEDSAALVGVLLAALGLALHQVTGVAAFDGLGSILVGVLLGVVALVLIGRNRRFLVGQEADPRVRAATIRALLALPAVDRVTRLRGEVVGPRMVTVVGDVDLVGDAIEPDVAVRLRDVEATLSASPAVMHTVLSLSAPDEISLGPDGELLPGQREAAARDGRLWAMPELDDHRWMTRAIELARRCPPASGAYSVGAVIVDEAGSELAFGFSREVDDAVHAEESALAKLAPGDPRLATATIYSSLEPCSERRSRPRPCARLILDAGIPRVVIAWREPSLFVADCQGVELLAAAGVTVVELPDLAGPARAVNAHLDS